jgi:three-Cys-motif partner protein
VPIYVDAFAGTGYRTQPEPAHPEEYLSRELVGPENERFLKGSARIALEVEPPFQRYIFVERDAERAKELEQLRIDFPLRAARIQIRIAEANGFLQDWCARTDWRISRAVVFLDPYGMQVDWGTIEAIAATHSIDLWLLFPLAMAVGRLLTKDQPPPEQWAQALTRLLGTDEWLSAFYPPQRILTLFGEEEIQSRQADFESIGRFFVKRLESVFARVAPNPLPLRNSKNVPLYLLCFATGNPQTASTAIRIANSILKR